MRLGDKLWRSVRGYVRIQPLEKSLRPLALGAKSPSLGNFGRCISLLSAVYGYIEHSNAHLHHLSSAFTSGVNGDAQSLPLLSN